jgi:septal ring factor EnvC (AmiA/AmiB activator)
MTLRIEEEGNSSLRCTTSIHQEELVISSPSRSRAQSSSTANTDEIEVLDNAYAVPLAPGSISIDSRNNMDSETKKKLHSMELEIVKLTTLLTTKKDFSQSLQAQVLLLEDDIHKKDLEIENFQQDLLSCQRKYQESCEMLAVTRNQIE